MVCVGGPSVGDGVDPWRGLQQRHGHNLRGLGTGGLPGRGGGCPPVPPGAAGLPQVRSEVRRSGDGLNGASPKLGLKGYREGKSGKSITQI